MGYLRQVTARGWIRTNVQYTLLCVKYTVRGKLLYNKRSSAQCSVMTYKGVMAEGYQGDSRGRRYMYSYS